MVCCLCTSRSCHTSGAVVTGFDTCTVPSAREMSAVRAFFGWLAEEGLASHGVLVGLRSPRVARRVPRPIAPADAIELANEAGNGASAPWIAASDTAVLLLLYGSGLRIDRKSTRLNSSH